MVFHQFQNQSRQAVSWTVGRLGVTTNPAMRAAVVTFVIILAIPLLLLGLVAVVAAALVYAVLRLAGRAMAALRNLGPRRDGRSNVRVIQRP